MIVTQGGDWGFYITRSMGCLYPQHVKANYINVIRVNPPQFTKHPLLALQHAIMHAILGTRKAGLKAARMVS
jgi:hypothetical protein